MKESDKQHFEDLIVKAVQSGKQETSGLVQDVTEKVVLAVKEQIQITVNGKIDGLKTDIGGLKDHLKDIDTKLDELTPVSDFVFVARKVRRFIVWVGPLIAFGLYKLFK